MNKKIDNKIRNAFIGFLAISCWILIMMLVIVANKKAEEPEIVYEKLIRYVHNTRIDINNKIKILFDDEKTVKIYAHYDEITGNRLSTVNNIRYAKEQKVPLHITLAQSWVESKFDNWAISENEDSKDMGEKQLNTKSFPQYSEKELLDLNINIREGVKYLRLLYDVWGNWEATIIAYNIGNFNKIKISELREKIKKGLQYLSDVLKQERIYDKMFAEEF